jgi:hypothetical protein
LLLDEKGNLALETLPWAVDKFSRQQSCQVETVSLSGRRNWFGTFSQQVFESICLITLERMRTMRKQTRTQIHQESHTHQTLSGKHVSQLPQPCAYPDM